MAQGRGLAHALPPALRPGLEIVGRLRAAGWDSYLVGGVVRDVLLGRTPADLDIVTAAPPDAIRALFARTLEVGAAFGVIAVVVDNHPYQVATFRREGPYVDGRHPTSVERTDAATDARRRDFTVNALLYDPVVDRVVDFVGGQHDLAQRLIRAVGDPDARFAEDHLRMLRAVRLAAELGFVVEPATEAAIARHVARLAEVSAERVRDELWRLLVADGRADGIRLAARTGVLRAVLPEALSDDDAALITRRLAAVRRPSPTLAMAAALLDAGPGRATAACRRLRCSGDEGRAIVGLVATASQAATIPRMTSGALRDLGGRVPLAELTELCRADAAARVIDDSWAAASVAVAASGVGAHLPRLLSGDDLAQLGYAPGPAFAQMLAEVETARARRDVADRDEARAWVLARFPRARPGAGSADELMEA